VRAFFVNIMAGGIRQGGSTITQQLSKILLTSRERNIFRKIKEAFIALMMEATYSKEEILQFYLNQIFLGHGSYGVESAAQFYFEKHIWNCSLAECALLASLPSAPNLLSPIKHTKASIQRHRIVLAKMVEMGFITIEQAEEAYLKFWPDYLAKISEMAPTASAWNSRVDRAPWFTEFIRRKLIARYGEEAVYNRGLLVYTTLDVNKQRAAERAMYSALERQTVTSSQLAFRNEDFFMDNFSEELELLSGLFSISGFAKTGSREADKGSGAFRNDIVEELEGLNYLTGLDSVGNFIDDFKSSYMEDRQLQKVEGALISINHQNGYIEAMVGGSPFTSINQLNRTMQSRRQPGSSIKPLLYAAAFESGDFTPATALLDSPIVYLDNEGGDWIPENYEGEYNGLVRLRKALALSINVVSIRIADKLGIDYVRRYYGRFLKLNASEIKERIPRNFSIALGSVEVSPFELTRAYAIIANGGKDVVPFSIRYVKDRDGKVLENQEDETRKILEKEAADGTIQIIKPETAQLMISVLRGVVEGGTGGSAACGRPAAGKTGTTNAWKDAWFVGFVPQLTTGIWIGYDRMGMSLGIGQAGGSVAAPAWGEYMRNAMSNEAVIDFPVYAGLSQKDICARSGLLPSSDCKSTLSEVFMPGTEPGRECETCKNIEYNVAVPKKGPRDNISRDQKQNVLKSLKRNSGESIINDIGDQLLK
jgi:penicillin-binding protein 1A